jgi:hypothetical protein
MEELQNKFFSDPSWGKVQKILEDYCDELLNMDTVDTTKDGETVRAEIIGRKLAFEKLTKFLNATGLIQNRERPVKKNPFA